MAPDEAGDLRRRPHSRVALFFFYAMVVLMLRVLHIAVFLHVGSFDVPARAHLTPGTLAFLQSAR
jgi:hypothetical protein